METQTVKLSKIKPNPANPRLIKDDKFNKLVQSLKDFPEMADIRPIVVNRDMVILGGNMRFKAMKEAGWKECPVVIAELTEEQEKEFIIKDNVGFGEWDNAEISASFDRDKLIKWGFDFGDSILGKVYERDGTFESNKCSYPITFFATQDEYDSWQLIKDELGIEDDTKALFDILKNKIL
jgi:hypothetical protein